MKCSCRTVMAGFDIKTNGSIPIAPEWVEKIERYEAPQVAETES